MVFACRYAGQAVAGRGGGIDEFLHPRVPRALEHMRRALNVGRHVLEGALDGGDDVADPREVKYIASAAEQAVVGRAAANVSLLQDQVRIVAVGCEVLCEATRVVDW